MKFRKGRGGQEGGGGLTGPQLLEGVTRKEGSAFFQGGCTFFIKNKLKFLMTKKIITKNSNWDIT